MAYKQASSGPSGEVQKLQSEITDEVNSDAQHIATAVFGKPGNMPDMRRVSDDELNARYRQAYQNQDTKWLTQEAQRDPEQFVTIARRIGVVLPEELGQVAPAPLPASPASPPQAPPPPPPPVPAPAFPPPAPVAVPPGINLGAIAQPAQPVPVTMPPVTQG